MPELLVVVLEVTADRVAAVLAPTASPGDVLLEIRRPRSPDLLADASDVLGRIDGADLAPVLLALAVSVAADVAPDDAERLRAALAPELPDGWGLPAPLPVVWGSTEDWAREGASVPERPAVAAAVVSAARSVGAHAHLPPL